jgi:hypothetical protein
LNVETFSVRIWRHQGERNGEEAERTRQEEEGWQAEGRTRSQLGEGGPQDEEDSPQGSQGKDRRQEEEERREAGTSTTRSRRSAGPARTRNLGIAFGDRVRQSSAGRAVDSLAWRLGRLPGSAT